MTCPQCKSIFVIGPPDIQIKITGKELEDLIERLRNIKNGEKLVINDPDFKLSFIRDDGAPPVERKPKEGNLVK
jgi:hypothetical protein